MAACLPLLSPVAVDRIVWREDGTTNGGDRSCNSPLLLSEREGDRIWAEWDVTVGGDKTMELPTLEIPGSREGVIGECSMEIKGRSEVIGRMEFTALSFSTSIELTALVFSHGFNIKEGALVPIFGFELELELLDLGGVGVFMEELPDLRPSLRLNSSSDLPLCKYFHIFLSV